MQRDEDKIENVLVKREKFAVKLRKEKKDQMLALKRKYLYGDLEIQDSLNLCLSRYPEIKTLT